MTAEAFQITPQILVSRLYERRLYRIIPQTLKVDLRTIQNITWRVILLITSIIKVVYADLVRTETGDTWIAFHFSRLLRLFNETGKNSIMAEFRCTFEWLFSRFYEDFKWVVRKMALSPRKEENRENKKWSQKEVQSTTLNIQQVFLWFLQQKFINRIDIYCCAGSQKEKKIRNGSKDSFFFNLFSFYSLSFFLYSL